MGNVIVLVVNAEDLIGEAKRNCREHGHVKRGHEYRPLVSCSLYMSLYR
jgi:hypothetical protein